MFSAMADRRKPDGVNRQTGRLAERLVANFAQCARDAFSPQPGARNIFLADDGTEVEWVNGIEEQMRPVDIVIRCVQQLRLVTAW